MRKIRQRLALPGMCLAAAGYASLGMITSAFAGDWPQFVNETSTRLPTPPNDPALSVEPPLTE